MQQSASAERERVFHTLDALRGIAAIGVVAYHFKSFFVPLAAPGGYLAVDLFFMMSGVVIAHAYETRFRQGMTTLPFMRARLIRLYPLYFLGTLIGSFAAVAALFGTNADRWTSASLLWASIVGLLFLPNFSGQPNDRLFPLNVPCWSLFLEILVNLLFVSLWPWLNSRALLLVCVLCGIGVGLITASLGHIDQGYTSGTFTFGLTRAIFGFAVGILISRHGSRAPRRKSTIGYLAIVAVVLLSIMGNPSGVARAVWDSACVILVFPIIVYLGTITDPPDWLQPSATFLGLTSYAIYILHGTVSVVLSGLLKRLSVGEPTRFAPLLGVVLVASLAVICWLIDRTFDNPIRRVLSRRLPGAPSRHR